MPVFCTVIVKGTSNTPPPASVTVPAVLLTVIAGLSGTDIEAAFVSLTCVFSGLSAVAEAVLLNGPDTPFGSKRTVRVIVSL